MPPLAATSHPGAARPAGLPRQPDAASLLWQVLLRHQAPPALVWASLQRRLARLRLLRPPRARRLRRWPPRGQKGRPPKSYSQAPRARRLRAGRSEPDAPPLPPCPHAGYDVAPAVSDGRSGYVCPDCEADGGGAAGGAAAAKKAKRQQVMVCLASLGCRHKLSVDERIEARCGGCPGPRQHRHHLERPPQHRRCLSHRHRPHHAAHRRHHPPPRRRHD